MKKSFIFCKDEKFERVARISIIEAVNVLARGT